MKYSLSRAAERELVDGATYYGARSTRELGDAFITEFERAVGVLCVHPELGAVWRGNRRRLPLRRFPYSVIYYLRDDEVRVVALAHQRRRPGYWRTRV